MIAQIVSFFLGWCLILGSTSAATTYLFCVCVTGEPKSVLMMSEWELLKNKFAIHAVLIVIGLVCIFCTFL